MATRFTKDSPRLWHVIDAEGQVAGRVATQVVKLLSGKHKPIYAANTDCGDYVVVLNADKIVFTGNKGKEKLYRWHTGHPGGLKTLTAKQMYEKFPDRILKKAVNGMLPKNRLRKKRMKRLRLFNGDEHDHASQLQFSQQYAPDYMATHKPIRVTPRPKGESGELVRDYPEGDTDEEVTRDAPEIEKMFFEALEEWEKAGGEVDWGESGRPAPQFSKPTEDKNE